MVVMQRLLFSFEANSQSPFLRELNDQIDWVWNENLPPNGELAQSNYTFYYWAASILNLWLWVQELVDKEISLWSHMEKY